MRKLRWALGAVLLILLGGYAAGGASGDAAGTVPKDNPAGDAWKYLLVALAVLLVAKLAWRRLRSPHTGTDEAHDD
ncbi:hypothetical protein AB0A95_34685, partial [Micromonospora sp. NPDC049230]|uniref:hypothetical protein n=1 Tax=Micromonospora sp. NPDC049230 TaxID=3155502 RepID=UPI0033DA8FD7